MTNAATRDSKPPAPGAAKRPPGRPRSEATRQAIIDAAVELLESSDYRDISIDRIAATARVGKQSIYRWWTSKADLLLDAYTARSLTRMPPLLPSGDAFADLEDDLKRYMALLNQDMVAKGVRTLVAEAQLDAEFRAKLYASVWKVRCESVHRILHHAVTLGQIDHNIDIEVVAHMVHGATWYRLLSGTSRPFDDEYARQVVAVLRNGVATRRAPRAGHG